MEETRNEKEKEREREQISKRLIIREDGYPTFRVSREQMEMPRAHRTVERKIKKIRSKTEGGRERRIHKSWRESLGKQLLKNIPELGTRTIDGTNGVRSPIVDGGTRYLDSCYPPPVWTNER